MAEEVCQGAEIEEVEGCVGLSWIELILSVSLGAILGALWGSRDKGRGD